MILQVDKLSFSYRKKILDEISFSIDKPGVIGLLGANGTGKSTLFKLILKLLKPDSGEIFVNGRNLKSYSHKDLAAELAYIPQSHNAVYNHKVLDVVSMGFAGRLGILQTPTEKDKDQAMELLKKFGIEDLYDQGYQDLSGGQRQLVLIARALIQDSKILLMDEPVANLDYGNQAMIMETIRDISKKGYTILISMHDPLHAFRYTDSVLVLDDKKLLGFGDTKEVLNEEVLEKIYGLGVSLYNLDHMGQDILVPLTQ